MIESIFFNPWIWIMPILIVLALLLVVIGIGLVTTDDVSIGGMFSIMIGGMGALFLIPFYFGFMLPPYDGSFYQTYRVTGELASMERAFEGDEGTMSQSFIATIDGVEYFIKSTDQRFRTVDVGDGVTLTCTKGFDYFVEPWLDCRFGG